MMACNGICCIFVWIAFAWLYLLLFNCAVLLTFVVGLKFSIYDFEQVFFLPLKTHLLDVAGSIHADHLPQLFLNFPLRTSPVIQGRVGGYKFLAFPSTSRPRPKSIRSNIPLLFLHPYKKSFSNANIGQTFPGLLTFVSSPQFTEMAHTSL